MQVVISIDKVQDIHMYDIDVANFINNIGILNKMYILNLIKKFY